MIVRLVWGPNHELADGDAPAFCGGASLVRTALPPLAIDFVGEQLRRLNPGKDGINDRLFALPRLGKL